MVRAVDVNEWLSQALESTELGIALLPAVFVLGVISAVGSGCNLAMILAVAGYAGASESGSRKNLLIISACFMIGTVIALSLLGALVGILGGIAGSKLGMFGKIFAGLLAVFFGVTALDLLPFKLPAFNPLRGKVPEGVSASIIFGFAVGFASIACSLACCGPLLPLVLGVAALKGQGTWGFLIMLIFALGYSLPLAGMILGIGFGKMTAFAVKSMKPIKAVAGILMIAAGFWILTTI